jgi:transposase-like protein
MSLMTWGIHRETLRKHVRQAEADSGKRGDLLTSEEREEIRKLRKENFELRRANEILKSARTVAGRHRILVYRTFARSSATGCGAGPGSPQPSIH